MYDCSVIIAAYNAEKTIKVCIHSVLQQDYNGSIEIIVVDDHSIDATASIAKNEGIILIRSENNAGAAGARNKGIAKANGMYIAFLDSDDIAKPIWLRESLNLLKGNIVGVGCSNDPLNQQTLSMLSWLELMMRHQELQGVTRHIGASGSVWLKDALILVEGFSEDLKCAEDVDLVERTIKIGFTVLFTPQKLIKVMFKQDMLSYSRTQILKVAYLIYFRIHSIINYKITKSLNNKYSGIKDLLNGVIPFLYICFLFIYPDLRLLETILWLILIIVINSGYTIFVIKNCKSLKVRLSVVPYQIFRSFIWSVGIIVGMIITITRFRLNNQNSSHVP